MLFDDTSGSLRAHLVSTHQASALNLGRLVHPAQGSCSPPKGQGAELRTDAAIALRAAQGLLLTTQAGHRAQNDQLEREALLDLLSQCAELFRSLGRSASERGAPAIDYAELEGLRNALDRWPAADSQAQGEPLLAMTGEAGIVSATPASQVHYAGKNHDTTAQDHLHLSSGGATRMQAGRGISVFAQDDGISAIAQRGKVRVQAQDDDILFNAQKSFHVSAGEGEVLISAPTIRLVADDGSYIRIGGGVEIGTSGKAIVHASDHDWLEPKTQSTEKMTFAGSSADQRLVFHYPGHQDLCPRPAAEQPYAIELDDGSSLKGLTDAAGRTPVVEREAMRKAAFSARREVPPQSAGQSKGDDS